MVHLKLLVMAYLKLLPMVNNRDRHSLVSNNLLFRVSSSSLQHNSRQPLSDSTGMPDELCRRNVLCCLDLD